MDDKNEHNADENPNLSASNLFRTFCKKAVLFATEEGSSTLLLVFENDRAGEEAAFTLCLKGQPVHRKEVINPETGDTIGYPAIELPTTETITIKHPQKDQLHLSRNPQETEWDSPELTYLKKLSTDHGPNLPPRIQHIHGTHGPEETEKKVEEALLNHYKVHDLTQHIDPN